MRRLGAILAAITLALAFMPLGTANAVSGAAFTTVNVAADGDDHCANGNPGVNCNIYDGKEFVWLNGGPAANGLGGDGEYFFVVLEPGGQPTPNDGGAKNLSDDFDTYLNRTFTIAGGEVSAYAGTHDFDSGTAGDPALDGLPPFIRLAPYADTTNPGGVYIMAICSLADGYPVDPRDCKYDAFKIKAGEEIPPAADLAVVKTVATSFDRSFTWTIAKAADKTLVKQVGGTVTFTYTITVTHDTGTDSNWAVSGTITVFNPNDAAVNLVDVTDALSIGGTCTVTGGTDATIPAEDSADFAYTCTAPSATDGTNTATAEWPAQLVGQSQLSAGSADFSVDFEFGDPNLIDECVAVTDTFAGSLGSACVGDANPKTFTYARTVPAPQFDCVSYDNTATFTTNDTKATGSASQTVKVCGPARTGGLTIGFWQNKNGQGIITTGAATASVCNSGTWLRQYAPFQDLSATATCAQVGTYVTAVIKAANASGTSMNAMLKAQMLATALDVYFSDPALGGNRINAPAPIGGVAIDLTQVCKNIGTCTIYEDVSGAFGGATSLTVSAMLSYAASQSDAGGVNWYANVKATQELAKDAFDAINNQVAFAP